MQGAKITRKNKQVFILGNIELLDKTRKINKLLHNSSSSKVVFNDICQVLVETLSSNILVLSKKGKILGVGLCQGVEEIHELVREGVIAGGMLPKVDCCITALEQGVKNAVIMDGRVPHAVLMELLTNEGAGTMVRGVRL